MIKTNCILKILIVGICMAFYGIPSAFSDDVTTEWRSGDEGGTQKGYATPSINNVVDTPSGGGTGRANSDPGETIEEPVDHDTYSNIYPDSEEGVAILPQAMVEYCKFNAAAAVKDLNIITECIKKYANAMNNSNVASKAEALHDYDTMRAQALNRTLIEATTIVSNVPNFDKIQDKYKEAGNGGKTEYDAIQANSSSHAMSTKMINDVWKLYSEYLQYLAIDGIASIDPTALAGDEKAEENKSSVKGSSKMKTKAGTTKAETVIEGTISGSSTGSGGDGGAGDGAGNGNGAGDGNGTGDGNGSAGNGTGTGDGNGEAGNQNGNDGNVNGGNDNNDTGDGDSNSKADPNEVNNNNQQPEEHDAYMQELLRQREENQGNNLSDNNQPDNDTKADPERDAEWNDRMDDYNEYIKSLLEQREGAQ